MLNFLNKDVEPGVFDPEAVRTLVAAFDRAWQSIQASGADIKLDEVEPTRSALAMYIIEQARRAVPPTIKGAKVG